MARPSSALLTNTTSLTSLVRRAQVSKNVPHITTCLMLCVKLVFLLERIYFPFSIDYFLTLLVDIIYANFHMIVV